MAWRDLGGGSHFRTIRGDGRKADVFYEPSGKWIALVEKHASPHAGPGEQTRIGAFDTCAKAKRAATMREA